MSWTRIFRSEPSDIRAERRPAAAPRSLPVVTLVASHDRQSGFETGRSSFDAIGQRDEVVRQRIGVMMDRLDDLKTLQADFSEIMSPMVRITEELSRASVRISELEIMLAQERQSGGSLRQEAADLVARLASTGSELSGLHARVDQAEASVEERDAELDELRITQRDKSAALENLERQLFAETEQNKAFLGENKALRIEAQTADTALARSEHELLGARERLAVLEQDNRRLQALSEEQGAQLADLGGRHNELEAAAEIDRNRARTLESKLAAETASRERTEAQFEGEAAAHRTERGGLVMKL